MTKYGAAWVNNISQCLEPEGIILSETAGKTELDLAKPWLLKWLVCSYSP